jgi:ribosomal protein S8
MSVQSQIRRYMSNNYGNLISTSAPIFDETQKIWKVQLKSDYPRIIQDDMEPQRRILRFITLRGLGEIILSQDLKVLEATPRDKCVDNLDSFLRLWLERAERIIVSTSSDQLARVSGAEFVLNPIVMIISNLSQRGFIYDWEIEDEVRPENIKQYLKLLEELTLVERKENGWRYGNLFTSLREKSKNGFEEFQINVLSHVIKERYSVIREILDIRRFETFVHIDTCYYAPSLEVEELLSKKEESIHSDYESLYDEIGTLRFRQILGELITVGALRKKDGYLYGNEKIFDQMLSMRDQLEEIAPRSAGFS